MSDERYNATTIANTLSLFMPEGEVIEIRALRVDGRGNTSGYFNDRREAIRAAAGLSGNAEGVYITLNPCIPDCLARASNRVKAAFQQSTTSDHEISRRRWLLIDVDPVRLRGISSTAEELRQAGTKARVIRAFLTEQGWPENPVMAGSGNGVHLLYRYETENSPEAKEALQALLRGLSERFSDERANVDPANFNAARICRLYGTMARKGDPTEERPHRISKLVHAPSVAGELGVVTLEQVRAIADLLLSGVSSTPRTGRLVNSPAVPLAPRPRRSGLDIHNLDVVAWFRAHEHYGRELDETRGSHAVRCPWEDDHSGGRGAEDSDTVIYDGRDDRMPGFRCQHAHCTNRRLREVLALWPDAAQYGARERAEGDYSQTDEGNVQRIVDRFGEHLRYCPELGGYLTWTGAQWKVDGKAVDVYEMIRDTFNRLQREVEAVGEPARSQLLAFVDKSRKWERVRAVVNAMATKRDIQARVHQFDENPFLLNCLNGTIDLRTGDAHTNDPQYYCTRIVNLAYNPNALCSRFDQFLVEIFRGNQDIIDFIWRAIGYTLTGRVDAQTLFFCYGTGSNGKSVLFDVLRLLTDEYGGAAAPGLLIEKKNDRHPTEVAALRGKRFVACVETGEGQRLAEELVKRLTGGDQLTGRFMRQDFFEFAPTHKLWLSANHKPVIRGTDFAIWRRIPLIPFTVTFKDAAVAGPGDAVKDEKLLETLKEELPGIFARAVKGAQEWFVHGLSIPDCIRAATEEYRAEMDSLGQFIEERCQLTAIAEERAADLYRAYQEWCKDNGEFAHSQKRFGTALTERGYERVKQSIIVWRGLRLLSAAELSVSPGDAG